MEPKIIHAKDVLLPDPLTQEKEAREARIREIIREELAAWEKSLPLRLRAGMGWPTHIEVK